MTATAESASTSTTAFDPTVTLNQLLGDIGLSVADAGGGHAELTQILGAGAPE